MEKKATKQAEIVNAPARQKDIVSHHQLGKVLNLLKLEKNCFQINFEFQIILKINFITSTIVRFQYKLVTNTLPDFSYAIASNFKQKKQDIILKKHKTYIQLSTKKLSIFIKKKNGQITIKNPKGDILNQDTKQPFLLKKSINKGVIKIKLNKQSLENEQFYGLGDKSCALNLKGEKLVNWCTDAFEYQAETDPLYRAIPFYIGLKNDLNYGIFLDSTHKTIFNFGKKKTKKVSLTVKGGSLNYYFIHAQSPLKIAQKYTQLTGTPDLPPLWALGYHQCRWSYFPDERVRQLAHEFRERQIPCDAIYLDIDYMDNYRCFTWNTTHFPKPKQLISKLKQIGFKTIVMIDPGIKVDENYTIYQEGKAKNVFCKHPDGEDFVAPVWPSECVFPDFTDPKVRDWWGKLYKKLLKIGVAGVWNDMNEPAVFEVESKTFPAEIRHNFDGQPCSHRKAHNIYGMQMARATFEGLQKLRPNKRPFVLSRANYAGGQRFAAAWTGDNTASWQHLQIANIQCQRMSISGFSFVGSDIGGFVGQPDGELFVRWLQLGVFHPLFRTHSMGYHKSGSAAVDASEFSANTLKKTTIDQEPWSFGEEATRLAKAAIELRYRLLPYLYSTFWEYTKTGRPMLLPLAFFDPKNKDLSEKERDFIVGRHLLISPVIQSQKIENKQEIYLPKNNWYDYWTGDFFEGKQTIKVALSPEKIPIFVRAGAVIPHYPVQQFVGEKKLERVTLNVYFTDSETPVENIFYEDAGEGYDYKKGDFSFKKFYTNSSNNLKKITFFKIKQIAKGSFLTSYKFYKIKLFGLPFSPKKCTMGGQAVVFEKRGNCWVFEAKKSFKEIILI